MLFQSTQPKRAATQHHWHYISNITISIHAAQEGCDLALKLSLIKKFDISIHAAQEGCDQAYNLYPV